MDLEYEEIIVPFKLVIIFGDNDDIKRPGKEGREPQLSREKKGPRMICTNSFKRERWLRVQFPYLHILLPHF